MKILITGGSGFIGTNLVEYYRSSPCNILNIDIKKPRKQEHEQYWKQIDIMDPSGLGSLFAEYDPDYVFHLAARTDLNGSNIEDYSANTTGLANVVDACHRSNNLKRVIFASSRLVCRIGYAPKNDFDYCPSTVYGESKVIGEDLVRKRMAGSSLSWMIVRPTSIWGPWFATPYKDFFESIQHGRYFHPGDRKIRKSFGYIENTVYELDKLMFVSADKINGLTLYLADYPPIEVGEMANLINHSFGTKKIHRLPIWLLSMAAKLGDTAKFFGITNPPLTTFRLNNLLTEMVYDLNPVREIVGDLPYSLEVGVQRTVDWMIDK